MNIIGKRFIWITISGILVVASLMSVVLFGLRQGIEFTGGTLWQVQFSNSEVSVVDVRSFFRNQGDVGEVVVVPELQTGSVIIRMKSLSEEEHGVYREALRERFGSLEELRFESIGPSIGAELRRKSLIAFVLVLLAISLYVTFAFRKVSYPVKSYKYGIITLATLFHDALVPVGLMAFLGWWQGVEAGVTLIVALLVVMGFSVHDTIVVFDRIRENVRMTQGKKSSFQDIVNASVNQTIARSVNTSATLIVVLIAIMIFGPAELYYFILLVLVGTVIGTYSSIFIASPLLTLWHREKE